MQTTKAVDSVELLWQWCRNGWDFRVARDPSILDRYDEYGDRVRYEMDVIVGKGLADYFLIVSDLVRFAKDRGIAVGPARGSAAASLVCFLTRITEIDPMRFPFMMFERFLDPSRDDYPDIDLDFDDDRRHEIVDYAVAKYGRDRVGNVANYMRFRGKTAIADVGRANNAPQWAIERLKNLIIDRTAGDPRQNESVHDTFELFAEAAKIRDRFQFFDLAAELEGDYKTMSMHAAGLLISPVPITDICSIYERDGKAVVAVDKKMAAYLGLLKVDLLGLSTMGAISRALHLLGMTLDDLYAIPHDDARTLKAFGELDLTGIFQFEGRTQRGVTKRVEPSQFSDLIDICALARPGPLMSGAVDLYVARKHGAPVKPIHPVVDELLAHTYGAVTFQEQVLLILARVGGFPATRIGDVRRIISAKLGEAAMNELYAEFEQGAADNHRMSPELAHQIWDWLVTSSKYLFNYAHSCSYAHIAFWCQWLKQNHPQAFYAGQLAKAGKEKLPKLMQDVLRHGIELWPPDPVQSEIQWSPAEILSPEQPDVLVAGFLQIPKVGPVIAVRMQEYRDLRIAQTGLDEVPDIAWDDYQAVSGVGPKTIEKIVAMTTAEDPFELNRVHKILDEYRRGFAARLRDFRGLPIPTHTSETMPDTGEHIVVWMGFVKKIKVYNEIERERSNHPELTEAEILDQMRDPELLDSAVLTCYDDGPEEVYVRVNRWRYPQLQSAVDAIELDDDIVIVVAKKREGGTGISLAAQTIDVLEQDEPEEDVEQEED